MDLVASTSTPLLSATGMDELAASSRATESFLAIGAVPVLQYLSYPPSRPATSSSTVALNQLNPTSLPENEQHIHRAVARLHQACQQSFGSTDALKFEIHEEAGNLGKRCTLIITRPDGGSRTYASPSTHMKKYEAKASVCTLAIQNGALEFIQSGESDPSSSVPSIPQAAPEASNTPLEMDESVKAIEQCCMEWTEGKIKPFWLVINEPKLGKTQGCALRIQLGRHNSRVYSVNTVHNGPGEAKKACAQVALIDGVIDYIKTWSPSTAVPTPEEPENPSPITLQQFFESLPQPFPEAVAGRTAVDINGPAWLNTTIQSARGGKLVPNFIWTVDTRLGLHGCLLRLERPGEVKSYLVDARFLKRAEAKAAVCLLAMSQGVGDYIRSVGRAVEERLSPQMRRHINDVLLTTLNAEYRKIHGPGIQPTFDYDMDLDACGATLILALGQPSNPQQEQRYSVPAEYRNRNDAKLAVVLHAVEQGAIEFLRFQGKPPPPGYVPFYAHQQDNQVPNRKRKNWDSAGGGGGGGGGNWSNNHNNGYQGGGHSNGNWQNKKPRMGGGGFQQGHHFGQPSQGGKYGSGQGQGFSGFGDGHQNGGGYQNGNKSGWNGQKKQPFAKKPHAPGSGQYGGVSVSPAAPPFKPGPRNGGGPARHTQQQLYPQSFSAPAPFNGAGPPYPPQQQQQQPPYFTSQFAYSASGPAPGVAQPAQAAYFGAGPQVPLHAQAGPSHMPFGAQPYGAPSPSVPLPGNVPYPYFPAQAQAQPAAARAPVPPTPQYYPQQFQYGAAGTAYPSVPGQTQVPGYQPYPTTPAPPQPPQHGYYPVAPTAATPPVPPSRPGPALPVPPAPAPIHTPTPAAPGSVPRLSTPGVGAVSANKPAASVPAPNPAFTAYTSPLDPGTAQTRAPVPAPVPPRPQTSLPLPPQPLVRPPPPPPVGISPPPPPPNTSAPPLPPLSAGLPPRPTSAAKSASTSMPAPKPASTTNATPGKTVAQKAEPAAGAGPSKGAKVAVSSVAKTNVTTLYDYCNAKGLPAPQWCQEIVKGAGVGEPKHKVWVVIGKTKFELPVLFQSLSQGQEKVAKKVVDQLKTNPKQVEAARS